MKRFLSLFLLLYLLFLPQTDNFCHTIDNLNFDTQNLFLWDYLPLTGAFPTKDTFYPYGFLYYFKAHSLPWFVLYSTVTPLLLTLIYFSLIKPLFKPPLLKLTIFSTIVFMVANLLGPVAFNRYGLLLAFGLLTAKVIFITRLGIRRYFYLGLITGLLCLPFMSEGLYLILLQLLLFTTYQLTRGQFTFLKLCIRLIVRFAYYGSGLVLGLLPLLIFLIRHGLILATLRFYRDTAYISEFAKLPYLVNDFPQIFILIALIIGVLTSLGRFYLPATRKTYGSFVLFTLTLCLLVIEQKNLVRAFGQPVIFYAIFICLGLFALSLSKILKPQRFWSLKAAGLYLLFYYFLLSSFRYPFTYPFHHFTLDSFNLSAKICTDPNPLSSLDLPKAFFDLKTQILTQNSQAKIFSFPYDPLFYLLFRQVPPPYPNAYEAAPRLNQLQNLNYLNEVTHVIYNPATQIIDGAPESVRTFDQFQYIVTHFTPVAYYPPYYLLERTPNPDFFSQANLKTFPGLYAILLTVNWNQLPALFGHRFAPALINQATASAQFARLSDLNQWLATQPQTSAHTYLILTFPQTASPSARLTLFSPNLPPTTLTFALNQAGDYLIPLDHLPAFIQPSLISSLDLDPPPSYLKFINQPNTPLLW